MLFLGMLSLLQVLFLPGYITLRFLNVRRAWIETALFSFGVSLCINYLLVLILAALHIYNRIAIYGIFFVELALLLWSCRLQLRGLFLEKKTVSSKFLNTKNIKILFSIKKSPLIITAQLVAIASALYFIYFLIYLDPNPKTIFSLWDAVVSWDRWANVWYHNLIPSDTREYPQLLPIVTSITYQFINNTIQLFAKIIFYIFPLAMIACLWSIGQQINKAGYYFGILFLVVFFIKIFGPLSVSGYADVPVAAMCLLVLYPLLLSAKNNVEKTAILQNIGIGTLIGIAAAGTKQSGIFLAVMYPLLVYLIALKPNDMFSKNEKSKIIMYISLALLLGVAPWYLHKAIQFYYGGDSSAIRYLISGAVYDSGFPHATLTQRFLSAFKQLVEVLGRNFVYIAIPVLLLLGCLADKIARKIALLLVIPMYLIWALGFSYDLRNIAFVIPFLSIVLGFGIQYVASYIGRVFQYRIQLAALISVGFVTAISLQMLSHHYNKQVLVSNQIFLQERLGNPLLNEALYSYFAKQPPKGKILTNDIYLGFLPILENYYTYETFTSIPKLIDNYKTNQGKYLLILEQNVDNKSISTMDIERYLQTHPAEFHHIFHIDKYLFYCILNSDKKVSTAGR